MRSKSSTEGTRVCAAALLALLGCATGCGCGASPGRPADAVPTSSSGIGQTKAPSNPSSVSPVSSATQTDPLDARPFMADPRLTDAQLAMARDDARATAAALQAALVRHKPMGVEAARWQYLLGRSLAAAGDPVGAAAAFDAAAATPGFVAADYARLEAASAYVGAAKHAEARDRLTAFPADLPISERARLMLADSFEALGSKDEALAIWRAHVAGDRLGARWAEISVRIAEKLLQGPKEEARGREAFGLLRKVAIRAPATAAASRAVALETQALEWIPADDRAKLVRMALTTRMERAEEFVAAGRFDEALSDANDVWKAIPPKDKVGPVACKAATIRADVLGRERKKREQAASAFGQAVDSCAKEPDQLVRALYNGAKTQAQLDRAADALAWFGRVEKEFAGHRLADDARLRAARIVRGMQDEPRFVAMLGKMPEDYPDGDMVEDGLFELAFHFVRKGDWKSAIAPLERSLQLRPREKDLWTGGRARYYLGRAYESTGRKSDAASALTAVVVEHPWSFYAVLAMSRLHASAPGSARPPIEQAEAREQQGLLFDGVPPALQGPPLTRAIELLRLGEEAAAKREIQTIDVGADDDAAAWALATLYAHAGSAELSYRIARARTNRWSGHHPKGAWRAAWELAYPRPYLDVVEREAQRSTIPIPLAYGIMREESAFDADVVSVANAYGLMQLILPTARQVAKSRNMTVERDDLVRPEVNVALGCGELGGLRTMFAAAPVLAIPSYNAGPGATKRWLTGRATDEFDIWVDSIPYEETRGYTRRVVSSVAAYTWLYEPSNLEGIALVPLALKI